MDCDRGALYLSGNEDDQYSPDPTDIELPINVSAITLMYFKGHLTLKNDLVGYAVDYSVSRGTITPPIPPPTPSIYEQGMKPSSLKTLKKSKSLPELALKAIKQTVKNIFRQNTQ
jgi:hypothetical protein